MEAGTMGRHGVTHGMLGTQCSRPSTRHTLCSDSTCTSIPRHPGCYRVPVCVAHSYDYSLVTNQVLTTYSQNELGKPPAAIRAKTIASWTNYWLTRYLSRPRIQEGTQQKPPRKTI